jgi:hypothetical protein
MPAVGSIILAIAVMIGAQEQALSLGLVVVGATMTTGFLWRSLPKRADKRGNQDLHAAWAAVDLEVRRSRRHSRSFVLLAVRGSHETVRWMRPLLRAPDQAWADGSRVFILLSECDAAGATGFIKRTQPRLPGLFELGQFGLAAFPADGVTMGGLIQAASMPHIPVDFTESAPAPAIVTK